MSNYGRVVRSFLVDNDNSDSVNSACLHRNRGVGRSADILFCEEE